MKFTVNLLPHTYRRQQMLRRRAGQWGAIMCAVLVTGWVWHRHEVWEDRNLGQRLEVLERQHAPTQRLLKALVEMRQQLDQLQQQELVARELERQRSALTLLGLVSQTAQKTGGRLRVMKLDLKDFQTMERAGSAAASGGGGGLFLGGISLDNPAVGELLEGLQDSGVFSRVELLVLKERESAVASLRDYEVRCEF
jgi:Tfp pilus assembly protein PilN